MGLDLRALVVSALAAICAFLSAGAGGFRKDNIQIGTDTF